MVLVHQKHLGLNEQNVGIGTTDPQEKLHVEGNGLFGANPQVANQEGVRISVVDVLSPEEKATTICKATNLRLRSKLHHSLLLANYSPLPTTLNPYLHCQHHD